MLRSYRTLSACALAVALVGATAPGASALMNAVQPDLVVASIHDFVGIVAEGDEGPEAAKARIQFTIWNRGTGASPATALHLAFQDVVTSTAEHVDERAEDAALEWSTTVPAPALLPGEWQFLNVYPSDYAAASPVPGDTGRWHVTATIDAAGAVEELDESNNVREKDVFTGSVRADAAEG